MLFGQVIDINTRFSNPRSRLSGQKERMEASKTIQDEMNSIVAEGRVLEAPIRNILPAVDRGYNLGENILVYAEVNKK